MYEDNEISAPAPTSPRYAAVVEEPALPSAVPPPCDHSPDAWLVSWVEQEFPGAKAVIDQFADLPWEKVRVAILEAIKHYADGMAGFVSTLLGKLAKAKSEHAKELSEKREM